MQSFVQQCVFYDLLLEKYSIRDLVESPNIWQLVSNASPARSFIYNRQVTICQDGAKLLNQEWTEAINDAEIRYAHRIFPKQPLAKQELLKRLPMSYAYLTKVTQSAAEIMQQNLMANVIKHSLIDNPPLNEFSSTKAQMQKRIANATIGDMAAYWLPIMKIVFECIMYGSFIFIFLLALFPFGLKIVKNYVYSLMWIQIWAPLYAIINLIVSFYAQINSAGVVTNGLTLTTMAGLQQINSDIIGMAGYISISVPFISTIVVKGMADGFTQLAQYIGGVSQSSALGVAQEMAAGNLSLDNTSFANHNAFNTSANHFDTSARMASGSINYQLPTGSNVSVMPDGTAVLDNRAAISSLGTSINLGGSMRTAASKQFENASHVTLTSAKAMVDQYSSGIRELYDLGSGSSHTASSGKSSTLTEVGGFTDSAHKVAQVMTSFERAHNLNKSQSTRLFGAVYADAHGGISKTGGAVGNLIKTVLGVDATLGIKGEASISKDTVDANLFNEAKRYAQDQNFSQLVDHSIRAIKDQSYRTGSEKTDRLSSSIGTSFDKGNTLRDETVTNYQKSQAYREAATISDECVASINQNASQDFVNWLSDQHAPNTTGKIGMYQAENMRTQQPELYQGYVEQYVRQQTQERLSVFEQQHMDKSQIAHMYKSNAKVIGDSSAIKTQHEDNKEKINFQAAALDVGQGLNSETEKQAENTINKAQKQVGTSEDSVNSAGKTVQRETKEKN